MSEKNEKVIEIGFKNESIQSCENPFEIFSIDEKPNKKEDLEKCLNLSSKLFTH
ncbi:MAG TPA: hypothetical protein VGB37_16210 [Candidatus Lokiarchaeia archaeon]